MRLQPLNKVKEDAASRHFRTAVRHGGVREMFEIAKVVLTDPGHRHETRQLEPSQYQRRRDGRPLMNIPKAIAKPVLSSSAAVELQRTTCRPCQSEGANQIQGAMRHIRTNHYGLAATETLGSRHRDS